MKAYLITTAALFGLLTLAHLWRLVAEPHLGRDVFFNFTTIISAVMCGWGSRLLSASVRAR